jgi:hypothetical protein
MRRFTVRGGNGELLEPLSIMMYIPEYSIHTHDALEQGGTEPPSTRASSDRGCHFGNTRSLHRILWWWLPYLLAFKDCCEQRTVDGRANEEESKCYLGEGPDIACHSARSVLQPTWCDAQCWNYWSTRGGENLEVVSEEKCLFCIHAGNKCNKMTIKKLRSFSRQLSSKEQKILVKSVME